MIMGVLGEGVVRRWGDGGGRGVGWLPRMVAMKMG